MEAPVVLAHMGVVDPRAYVRLAAMLRQQIADGRLQPGERTPSLARLSQKHGHAPLTCSKALRMLEGEGLVTRIPGLGYHVRHS
jgi:DNA-binding GntR family transcriptional regulator